MYVLARIVPVLLVLLLTSVTAFAGDIGPVSEEIDLFLNATHVDDGDGEEAVALSPKVSAFYTTDGSSSTNQWYAISTGHVGGSVAYAASQNASNVYSQEFSSPDALSALLQTVPTQAVSADSWGTWERM
ncbi:MAG: hypothetical protein J7K75_07605 [Desulfuromonas sp.]|nr:hypothetical protein [Desulfuromonas sp.]